MNITLTNYNFTDLKELESFSKTYSTLKIPGLENYSLDKENLAQQARLLNIARMSLLANSASYMPAGDAFGEDDYTRSALSSGGYGDDSILRSDGRNFLDNSWLFSGDSRLDFVKKINLTSYAKEKFLKTDYGEVEVFLDLYDDNDKLGIGKVGMNAGLIKFDSNGDGILDSSDNFFDKLKVRGYDENGNEKIAKLSSVANQIDLSKFIKSETTPNAKSSNADEIFSRYSAFDPQFRYKKLKSGEISEFFKKYAGKNGWVNLRDNQALRGLSFGRFAYAKKGFDGEVRLSEFNLSNPKKEASLFEIRGESYEGFLKKRFARFYKDYREITAKHKENMSKLSKDLKDSSVAGADELSNKLLNSKSYLSTRMERWFKNTTGLEFNERNLELIKKSFENDADDAAGSFYDHDPVAAMKLNDDGTVTLRFDSGREINVNELYSDTGKLLEDDTGRRAGVNLKAKTMSEEELNSLDFNKVGIRDEEGRLKTLKEIGASAIKSFSTKHGKQFLIYLGDNKTLTAKDLYNISFLNNEFGKGANVGEKDRFYKKIDLRV